MLRVGGRFARVEPRRRMAAFVRGLLAGLPRVNCWSIAEHAGDTGPRGMQRLLSAAVWDDAGVRDDLRGYVLEHFAGPGAVLVVDETGDLKRGTATVGTQRQYTGTAGRTSDGEYAFYRAHAPGPVPLAQLVKVAGSRWKIEDAFAGSKELAALDEHQVRGWTSWHRWTILALLAHAFLAVLAATQADHPNPDDDQLIPLTCNEIRRLFTGLGQQPPAPRIQLHWSRWRRRHQYTARACHYRQRALKFP